MISAEQLLPSENDDFAEQLRKAAKPDLTADEFREQAISFIMEGENSNDEERRERIRQDLRKRFG